MSLTSVTLQLKMLMEAPETLHITGISQTALSCALPALQLLSDCWVIYGSMASKENANLSAVR